MDRRQQKTRDLIFKAFHLLLAKKRYNHITVQEIIDEANIGRSTFYAHFETKDELLKAMCTDVFHHVFSNELPSETTHDFSGKNSGLEESLTHLLHHIKDGKNNIAGILSYESNELFMKYFKEYLAEMFSTYINVAKVTAPVDFVLHYLVGSCAETVKWWIDRKMKYTPEETVRFFMGVSGVDQMTD